MQLVKDLKTMSKRVKNMLLMEEDLTTEKKESTTDRFLSMLFAVINSGKFWRCIRWCDHGKTMLITSPELFERNVLRNDAEGLETENFQTFVDKLNQIGFRRVSNQRPSKLQKFRHPRFHIKYDENYKNDKVMKKEEVESSATRQRSKTNKWFPKNTSSNGELEARSRKRKLDINEARNGTATKRKRSTNDPEGNASTKSACKKQRCGVPIASADSNTRASLFQPMGTVYNEAEMVAAHALLSLSGSRVKYSVLELTAAHTLVNMSQLHCWYKEGSALELQAAQALVNLANVKMYS